MNEDECSDLQQYEMDALAAIYGEYADDTARFEYSSAQPVSGSVEVEVDPGVAQQLIEGIDMSIRHLPPIKMSFTLPPAYPLRDAPQIDVSCCWLDGQAIEAAKRQLADIWELQQGMGVLHSYIDALKYDILASVQKATIGSSSNDRETIMAYDRKQKRKEFEAQSYTCAICIEEQSGKHCLQLSCGHVFCRSCLSSYLGILIEEGSVNQLQCPDMRCRKTASTPVTEAEMDELLSPEQISRYRRLYEQRKIDGDRSRYAWCPRAGCGRGVESDAQIDRLCQCPCGYAFCRLCLRTWHGPNFCEIKSVQKIVEMYIQAVREDESSVKRLKMEKQYGLGVLQKLLREHEQEHASIDYIRSSTQQCPKCRFGIEKTYGCNHMHCSQCDTHFCYLCGTLLNKENPTSHFNAASSGCNRRLFEGIEGTAGNPEEQIEDDNFNLMIRLAFDSDDE
ncbi:hypothetical protein LPJ53_005097 [Coemansia erecta]|uniref:RBR-type E3 ubiquitin transferase n=1 Tax=Coemansia erecta TaxID=147472 RepID=A0A9W7XVR1_9FUNG|nr:hypothetical protein LPJ53_005097 [Coemansia erecta]